MEKAMEKVMLRVTAKQTPKNDPLIETSKTDTRTAFELEVFESLRK